MATQNLLNRLDSDMTAWNEWRAQNQDAYIDLTHTDLSSRDLSGFDLSFADFSGSNLQGATLANADLSFALFVNTRLDQTCLTGARLEDVNFTLAFVDGISLSTEPWFTKPASYTGTP